MSLGDRQAWRTTLIVALLVASFLLTAFLAVRGQLVARYHRATAEKVIRDWALLAAAELERRLDAQSAFYGTYPVLQAIAASPTLPAPADLAAAATSAEMRRNTALVRDTFRYDVATGTLAAGPSFPPPARAWLVSALAPIAADPPPPPERLPLQARIDGEERTFVYLVAPAADRIDGFEVAPAALAPFVPLALATGPLLPPSLAEGRVGNDALVVRVTLADGAELHRSAGLVDPLLGVRRRVTEGLLRGALIELSIAPTAARLLVFGGLPRPSTAVYLVPLALAAGLLATAALQLRKERALQRLRAEFVAGVSHELRTPLTQIRMFAETLLLDRVRSAAERTRALAVIDQEARRLSHLVDNVLQFSRGERGALRLTRGPLDLATLVRSTLDAFAPIAAARETRLVAELPAPAPVVGDEDALRQVLVNLLDNAVKYGPVGQEVVIGVAPAPGIWRLTVDDQGPGVPARDRRRVFRRYERLDRERGRAIAGAGIGLAVVRDIVALHGGRARVETAARGGARFVVELPREAL
jgi:signal transduction histidine kinase